jgi:hypothetical protein
MPGRLVNCLAFLGVGSEQRVPRWTRRSTGASKPPDTLGEAGPGRSALKQNHEMLPQSAGTHSILSHVLMHAIQQALKQANAQGKQEVEGTRSSGHKKCPIRRNNVSVDVSADSEKTRCLQYVESLVF